LQDEGYTTSFMTMQDEAKIKLAEKQTQRSYFKRMRKAILGARPPCAAVPGAMVLCRRSNPSN
jgi:hypothetical protein